MNTQEHFQRALDSLVSSLQGDTQVVAAILTGSLAYDVVWEKSDIDLTIVVEEQKLAQSRVTLIQDGIPVHAELVSRNELRRRVEQAVAGSPTQSFLMKSRLLFTKDPTIEDVYADVKHIGSRDRDLLVMVYGSYVVELLTKIEKWLWIKKDPVYASVFLTNAVQNLARVVTVLHDEVPLREAIDQAVLFEPELFRLVYQAPADEAVTKHTVERALAAMSLFVAKNTEVFFKPMLDHLRDHGDIRTMSEIDDHFRQRWSGEFDASVVCRWLAEQGLVVEASADVRITSTSRVNYSQPAYMVSGDGKELAL
jgi:uncharacterized protein